MHHFGNSINNQFLTSKVGWYHRKIDENNEKKIEFNIPRSVKRYFILVTKENDHGRYREFKKAIKNAKFRLLVFLRKTHPGSRKVSWNEVINDLNQNKKQIINDLIRIYDGN